MLYSFSVLFLAYVTIRCIVLSGKLVSWYLPSALQVNQSTGAPWHLASQDSFFIGTSHANDFLETAIVNWERLSISVSDAAQCKANILAVQPMEGIVKKCSTIPMCSRSLSTSSAELRLWNQLCHSWDSREYSHCDECRGSCSNKTKQCHVNDHALNHYLTLYCTMYQITWLGCLT